MRSVTRTVRVMFSPSQGTVARKTGVSGAQGVSRNQATAPLIGEAQHVTAQHMNPHLDFLLSVLYDRNPLAPEHLADLRRSGLVDETIRLHKFRSVPPHMLALLLGFDPQAVRSAMLLPFPDPATGGFMDHIRVKIFPSFKDRRGNTVKYLQPRRSRVRLYFPRLHLDEALGGARTLWLVEAEKKALAVAQLRLPAVGFPGIHGWHEAGSRELLPDFALISLNGRIIELVPDGDWRTNPHVRRGAEELAVALSAHGARPRLVVLPESLP